MGKWNKTQNFYAVHYIGDKEDVIVHSWAECIEARKDYPNLFKKFETENDARIWLASITPEQEQKHLQTMEYVDAKNANKVQRTVWIDQELLKEVEDKLSCMNIKLTDLIEDLLRDYVSSDDDTDGHPAKPLLDNQYSASGWNSDYVAKLQQSALENIDRIEDCIRSFPRYPSADSYRNLVIDIHKIVYDYVTLKASINKQM